jgi:hypothetical protein
MTSKSYCVFSAVVFALVALVHLVRAVMEWPITVNGYSFPVWASWIAFVVAATLSEMGYRAAMRK